MKGKYSWNGRPVTIEHVWVLIKEVKDKPLYWYNYDCSTSVNGEALFPALEITTQEDAKFIIDNSFGLGINKCRKGGMWTSAHRGFDDESIVEVYREGHKRFGSKNIQFSEEQYLKDNEDRNRWQKYYYPEEFERSEQLRIAIRDKTIKGN